MHFLVLVEGWLCNVVRKCLTSRMRVEVTDSKPKVKKGTTTAVFAKVSDYYYSLSSNTNIQTKHIYRFQDGLPEPAPIPEPDEDRELLPVRFFSIAFTISGRARFNTVHVQQIHHNNDEPIKK